MVPGNFTSLAAAVAVATARIRNADNSSLGCSIADRVGSRRNSFVARSTASLGIAGTLDFDRSLVSGIGKL